jgi:hypothetical protein
MKVQTITATIRYSQDTGKGAWKVLELGAEATIEPEEDWEEAQSRLYQDLGQQFRRIWGSNGASSNHAPDDPRIAVQPSKAQEPPRDPQTALLPRASNRIQQV